MLPFRTLVNRIRAFRRDQDGSATIEGVLWMPVFILIFGLIADASLLFHAQAQLTRIVQDANRAYSVGRLDSEIETQNFIRARLGAVALDANTSVTTTVNGAGIIQTIVNVPAYEYAAVGFFTALTTFSLTISSQHVMES